VCMLGRASVQGKGLNLHKLIHELIQVKYCCFGLT